MKETEGNVRLVSATGAAGPEMAVPKQPCCFASLLQATATRFKVSFKIRVYHTMRELSTLFFLQHVERVLSRKKQTTTTKRCEAQRHTIVCTAKWNVCRIPTIKWCILEAAKESPVYKGRRHSKPKIHLALFQITFLLLTSSWQYIAQC